MKQIILLIIVLILITGCTVKKPEAASQLEKNKITIPEKPVLVRDKKPSEASKNKPSNQKVMTKNDFHILYNGKETDSLEVVVQLIEVNENQLIFSNTKSQKITMNVNLGKNIIDVKKDISYKLNYSHYLKNSSFNKILNIASPKDEQNLIYAIDETNKSPIKKSLPNISFFQDTRNSKLLNSFNGVRRELVPINFNIYGKKFTLNSSEEKVVETKDGNYLVFVRHSILQSPEKGENDKVLIEGLPFYYNLSITKIK